MKDMQDHLRVNADDNGNWWCHCEGCAGTYTPYRINIWGLRNTEANREDGKEMVKQQLNNVLRHLQKAHAIMKDMQDYLRENTDQNGDLWCHCEGCAGTYTPYHINIWGLRNTAAVYHCARTHAALQINLYGQVLTLRTLPI